MIPRGKFDNYDLFIQHVSTFYFIKAWIGFISFYRYKNRWNIRKRKNKPPEIRGCLLWMKMSEKELFILLTWFQNGRYGTSMMTSPLDSRQRLKGEKNNVNMEVMYRENSLFLFYSIFKLYMRIFTVMYDLKIKEIVIGQEVVRWKTSWRIKKEFGMR